MFQSIGKNGALLAAFALATTSLIGVTHILTKDRIAAQQALKLKQTLNEVIPPALYDNVLLEDCIEIPDPIQGEKVMQRVYRARSNNTPTALAIESTAPNGYSGDIHSIIGVDTQGNVLGVRVLDHKETPGLGDKVDLAVSDWVLSFTNKHFTQDSQSQWQVKKDGGQFDQFTGATITPRAVVGSVASTLSYVITHQQTLFDRPSQCSGLAESEE